MYNDTLKELNRYVSNKNENNVITGLHAKAYTILSISGPVAQRGSIEERVILIICESPPHITTMVNAVDIVVPPMVLLAAVIISELLYHVQQLMVYNMQLEDIIYN